MNKINRILAFFDTDDKWKLFKCTWIADRFLIRKGKDPIYIVDKKFPPGFEYRERARKIDEYSTTEEAKDKIVEKKLSEPVSNFV